MVEELSVSEQIARRQASAVVINLEESEGWTAGERAGVGAVAVAAAVAPGTTPLPLRSAKTRAIGRSDTSRTGGAAERCRTTGDLVIDLT